MKVKPRQHVLKSLPGLFAEIRNGERTSDLRKNDRGFRRGDELRLEEYIPPKNGKVGLFTGSYCICIVTAVLEGFVGLENGYCVLSIRLPASSCGFDRKLAGKKG